MGPIGQDCAEYPGQLRGQVALPDGATRSVGIWLPRSILRRRTGGWAITGQSVARYLAGYFGSSRHRVVSERVCFRDDFVAIPYGQKHISRKPAGSAYALASNTVITAGHCLRQVHHQVLYDLNRLVIAFGFDELAQRRRFLPADCVVDGRDLKLVFGSFAPSDISVPDVAVLRLPHRCGKHFANLEQRPANRDQIHSGQRVYMLGHRHGLPCMVTTGRITSTLNHRLPFVFTDLTLFEGNSGSPVFDQSTHRLLGWVTGGLPHVGYGVSASTQSGPTEIAPLEQPPIENLDYPYHQSPEAGSRMMIFNSSIHSQLPT